MYHLLTNDGRLIRRIHAAEHAERLRARGHVVVPMNAARPTAAETAPQPQSRPTIRCEHLGEPLRFEQCPSCSGNVSVRVFACDLHGECQSRAKLPGVRSCSGCGDFVSRDEPKRREARVTTRQLPVAKIAIVVACHNYGRFLDECLDSVVSQTLAAAEIVVVDDASDDRQAEDICDRRGIRYLRVEHRNVYLTRRDGLLATSAPFVVFLDADDRLEPTYLADCAAEMLTDESLALVTSDLMQFGDSVGRLHFRETNMEQMNFAHAGSLVRRNALEVSAAFEQPIPPTNSHADWYVWRSLVRGGWKIGRIPAASYLYRRHGQSMMASRDPAGNYYAEASLDSEQITLVLPISGRERYWDRLAKWAESQSRITDVLVIDTSDLPRFRSLVKSWLSTLDVRSTKYVSLPPSEGLADADRKTANEFYRAVQRAMPRIYRQMRESVTTEFVMVVEDDVLPPTDAVDRLLAAMQCDVAAVSGLVPSRWQNGLAIAHDENQVTLPLTADTGRVDQVGGTGFGCLLLRRSAMLSVAPFNNGGRTQNYDVEFARMCREARWKWLMDWSVRCDHGEISLRQA